MVLTIFFLLCFIAFSLITYGFSKDAQRFVQPIMIKGIFISSAILALWTFLFLVIAFLSWLI